MEQSSKISYPDCTAFSLKPDPWRSIENDDPAICEDIKTQKKFDNVFARTHSVLKQGTGKN